MNHSIRAQLSLGAIVAAILIAVLPATAGAFTVSGDGHDPAGTEQPAAAPDGAFIPRLPRSAEAATPFVAEVAPEALPRDPGQATPFVAEVAPEAVPAGDGFDWGAAAIGAGAALLAAALLAAGSGAVGRGRSRSPGRVAIPSQG
jgi:hypothetical protein